MALALAGPRSLVRATTPTVAQCRMRFAPKSDDFPTEIFVFPVRWTVSHRMCFPGGAQCNIIQPGAIPSVSIAGVWRNGTSNVTNLANSFPGGGNVLIVSFSRTSSLCHYKQGGCKTNKVLQVAMHWCFPPAPPAAGSARMLVGIRPRFMVCVLWFRVHVLSLSS